MAVSGRDDSGPAFAGMSLRDYFAAKAMHKLMDADWISHGRKHTEYLDHVAAAAYVMADAMLKARGKT